MSNCKNNTTKLRELLLKAQSLPSAGSGEYNGPVAYTVSNVDELPTNAADGSMALVIETYIYDGTGNWFFFDELPNLGEYASAWQSNNYKSPFRIEFTDGSGLGTFDKFSIGTAGNSSWGIYTLVYHVGSVGYIRYTHNPSGSYGITHGWSSQSHRSINVSFADNEAKAWLEANATRTTIGEPVTEEKRFVYLRENSEWTLVEEYIPGGGSTSNLPNAEDYTF